MTTITFDDDIKTSTKKFKNFQSFANDFVKNNYPESNISNEYDIASKMKDSWLPNTFIKNFVKSYD